MFIHVVKSGESLYTIAKKYKVSQEKIISDNELNPSQYLVIGQNIVILEGVREHKVVPGQSLYSIARDYRITVSDILKSNPGLTQQIQPGQIIVIPPKTNKLGWIYTNGYTFPNIDSEVLKKTLPYLSYISIFSYEVNEDGSLTTIDDTEIIKQAREAGVAPMMVITNLSKEGGFSSDLVKTILNDKGIKATLTKNILDTLKNKNYYGLDIDFEYIYPQDRENYNDFLRNITKTLNDQGYTVTTALAPKEKGDKIGVLYEAHDYPVHGELVDHVIIMTYEWGYTYGPPQAVAPANEVRKVIEYAITVIPNEKIFMGVPNYGYDWTLPYVKGTAAKTITNTEAVDIARREGGEIKYDTIALSPYFNYYDDLEKEHVVWFEDARSIYDKLAISDYYDLGGVSYWTINKYFPQNWLVLKSLFDIKKLL